MVWQPSERPKLLSNKGVANLDFEEIVELEESLVEPYVVLCTQPEVIHWYTRSNIGGLKRYEKAILSIPT